jgi:cytochrome c peroxidase
VPAVEGNAVTHEWVELGRMQFFDPRLSRCGLLSGPG